MTPYRVGAHNPRNIYRSGVDRDTDEHIGVMFAPETARLMVLAANDYRYRSIAHKVRGAATLTAADTMPDPLINARDRLARIAEAHVQEVGAGGLTSGYCLECDRTWPCPTYDWASGTRTDPLGTWERE